jgi:hypothetical protein
VIAIKGIAYVKLLILITVVFAVLWSPYFIVFGIEVSRYLFLEVFISTKRKYNSMGYHTTITILGYRDCITSVHKVYTGTDTELKLGNNKFSENARYA